MTLKSPPKYVDEIEMWHLKNDGESDNKSVDVLIRNGVLVKRDPYLHNTDGDGNRHKRKEDEWELKAGAYEMTDLENPFF
jgi:hypothetical protein